ncbi:hypothetical protein [Aurantiacibacter poecillastricola]|uniref:hypothetical protein n=1 Tax=Aurantiacibacter poecillastricola TaxID=3064385 RepID=UPI00273D5D86|nr:hypothetical protein [Aurantiacibacter sp. 219JJ12-13]MDP5262246.1 hypothetical protein [Aurantiacibacter sp. 219JJ12-13]
MSDPATRAATFARRVYIAAAIYGCLAVPMLYFTDAPDPHRLLYFAFAGIALVFQGVFLVIARDPLRYAPFLPLTVFEKLSFGIPALAFWSQGQAADDMALGGAVDLLLAALFAIAWLKVRKVA